MQLVRILKNIKLHAIPEILHVDNYTDEIVPKFSETYLYYSAYIKNNSNLSPT